jgi:formylglycine-generating enzyme required for sulfatase activity
MQSNLEPSREPVGLDSGLLSRRECAPDGVPFDAARPGTEIGLMAGQEVGPQARRYRLERQIARGGTAEVWQATDLATHATLGHSDQVALKILAPELTRNRQWARLLIAEATRARRLAHEHIVRVYDWAQDPATGSYFLIMECLDGEDLDGLLARTGPLPLPRVLELLAPVAAALDYAWKRHGLVHRDIKPGNVFLVRDGAAKLLDFGIAARGPGTDGALEAPATSGTAGYRAPEAGTPGQQPKPTLDVHAVAVMICQLVGGALPFGPARAPHAEPIRPAALDASQWRALRAGLAFDPEQRPPTVGSLLRLLRDTDGVVCATPGARMGDGQAAARQALLARQRREHEQQERAARETLRRERREVLRQQLLARRAQQAEAGRAHAPRKTRADPPELLRDLFLDGAGAGPALVRIPAGAFQMGSSERERGVALVAGTRRHWLAREAPPHPVVISRPFALGRYPVTVGEWREFVRATGWQRRGEVDWAAPGFAQTDAHPVVGISWHDAQQYLAWLSERTGQRYRLPTEAQWEYACRAGTSAAFSFGDTITTDLANYDGRGAYDGGRRGVFRKGTTAAGRFAPNAWGLCDMHGNVWEWVQDALHPNYDGAPRDGSAWEEGGDPDRRILRGGCWLYHPRYLRAALRNGFSARLCSDVIGFRVARDLAG